MAYDLTLLAAIAISIVFLAVLVWKMYEHARQPEWSEVSAQARTARREKEKEHGQP